MEVNTDTDSEIPMRDTTPAPPLIDEVTKTDNRLAVLPSPTELLDAVGDFSREMRDSIQEIRTAVQDNTTSFLAKLDALEKRFDQRLQHLTDEVSRVHQQHVQINVRLDDLELRVGNLELDKRRLSEAP